MYSKITDPDFQHEALYGRAMIFHKRVEREQAIGELNKMIEIDPSSPLGYDFLATILRESGQNEQADLATQKACQLYL